MKRAISLFIALVLAISVSVVSFAAASPGGKTEYDVTISSNKGGSTSKLYKMIKNNDGTVTLVHISSHKDFLRWKIIGDYELVKGPLTADKIIVYPLEDLKVKMIFEKGDKDGKDDDGSKSPQTADKALVGILSVAVLAGAAAVVSKKSLNK